jgi:hypothetical protein
MINYFRTHNVFRGTFIGVCCLVVLEIGMIAVLAGFNNKGIWDSGDVWYYLILTFIAITTALLGVGIACKFSRIKKITYLLISLEAIAVVFGIIYNWWWLYSGKGPPL